MSGFKMDLQYARYCLGVFTAFPCREGQKKFMKYPVPKRYCPIYNDHSEKVVFLNIVERAHQQDLERLRSLQYR